MKRGIGILLGLALIWVIANLPAGLIRLLFNEQQITVIAPQGTVWNGEATLVSSLGLQGRCRWHVSFLRSGTLQPTVVLQITDNTTNLQAPAQIDFSGIKVVPRGTVDSTTLQPLLQRYDLFLTGRFDLEESTWLLHAEGFQLVGPATVNWSGGPVRYILANTLYTATMPPLYAQISTVEPGQLEVAVYPAGTQPPPAATVATSSTPRLLSLRISQAGSIYVAVSRGLLRLANFPWQGDEADTDLIFEIERSL